MLSLQDFSEAANPLAEYYRRSNVDIRILLTGHQHQASPDVARQGQDEAWDGAATHVEARWDEALIKQQQVREGFAKLLDTPADLIALDTSTHDLLVRFLGSLPLAERPRIITSSGENPNTLRQLFRVAEAGAELIVVDCYPADSLAERIISQIDSRTSAVVIASVVAETGHQTLEFDTLMPACAQHGAELLIDVYQHANVLPFSIQDYNLERAFVVGGGTRYCQMGDGLAYMHVPEHCQLRPWSTTRYNTSENPLSRPLQYGDGHRRFDGATYDPTAHYRAVHVFQFFRELGLDPDLLHDINHRQLQLLVSDFQQCDFDPDIIRLPTTVEYMGGFIAFECPEAKTLCSKLRDIGVHTDASKHWLRMGPAPYVGDEQLHDAIIALKEAISTL